MGASCDALSFGKPRPTHTSEGSQALETVTEHALASRREPIRTAPILGRQRLDPLARLEPRNRAIERARTQDLTRYRLDVLRHGITVLRAVGERNEFDLMVILRVNLFLTLTGRLDWQNLMMRFHESGLRA